MTKERAREIWNNTTKNHPCWADGLDLEMTQEERDELTGIWKSKPGHWCFADVFFSIMNCN